jgi:hypothetical protein
MITQFGRPIRACIGICIGICSLAAALGGIASLLSTSEALAQTAAPDYANDQAGKFLRFLNARDDGITEPPRIGLSFGERTHRAVLDSGSTGIVVAASLIPNVDQLQSLGDARLTYTSSGRIMLGRWVVTPVSLVGEHDTRVSTDPMPVIAVTQVRCLEHARDCEPNDAPRDIAMVGVGFGREGDRQSQSTPDKNPLLRIAWDTSAQRRGYILTATGVHIGLTRANTQPGFSFIKLARQKRHDDWTGIPACIVLDGRTPPACGSMLVDTGVSAMFMTVPPAQADDARDSLPDGTDVSIRVGTADHSSELYRFTVGGGSALAPRGIHLRVSPQRTFVNTSVHLLNGFDLLYDADGGYAGFRQRQGLTSN